MTGGLVAIGIVIVLLLIILPAAIKIVPEYQRMMVFRLGRALGTKGPGLILLIPLVDRGIRVDLREQYLEIPHQTAITEDNAPISIDFIVFTKVVDAQMSVLAVQNFEGAAQNIAATTLRSVVGDMSLDDVLAKRETMNEVLRAKLDEVTERCGVKVTNVEIREIVPPQAVQEAMTRQMSAERTPRAVVTEAEATKPAAMTVPEGNEAPPSTASRHASLAGSDSRNCPGAACSRIRAATCSGAPDVSVTPFSACVTVPTVIAPNTWNSSSTSRCTFVTD